MPVNISSYNSIAADLLSRHITLVAVSKTKPVDDIKTLMELGQLDFGENYVQELLEKQAAIQANVRWHFIGHLQTNKVKQIVPFVYLVHSVDSLKLLKEINKQAQKINRVVNCLLQIHIAQEETKFGFNEMELQEALHAIPQLNNISIQGLMGMATLTDNEAQIRSEYQYLKQLYTKLKNERAECASFNILSMGMSGDYKIAAQEGSTMVRIGSLIFGERNYNGSK